MTFACLRAVRRAGVAGAGSSWLTLLAVACTLAVAACGRSPLQHFVDEVPGTQPTGDGSADGKADGRVDGSDSRVDGGADGNRPDLRPDGRPAGATDRTVARRRALYPPGCPPAKRLVTAPRTAS